MRTCINIRRKFVIEGNNKILKKNYGSRSGYSMENVLLEKRTACDFSMHNRKVTPYSITDLEALYNGQPPDIGGIVLEAAGVYMKLIKLTSKTSNNFEHFTCASCGISKESHGSKNE